MAVVIQVAVAVRTSPNASSINVRTSRNITKVTDLVVMLMGGLMNLMERDLRFGKHKCEDNYEYWQKCESWCKRHGFCPEWYNGRCGSNKDAESIAYIRTGECVGENFHVEDFQDEDFQDEDFKDDPKESQDE
jgi:hypothetical protein